MRTCFSFLIFSLFATLFAQTPDYVFPKVYYDDFISADFELSSGNGFALGQCGILLRTDDSGSTWTRVAGERFANGGDNLVVSCVPGTQCQTAIIVAGSGLARTTDFGATWSAFTNQFANQILHLPNGSMLGLNSGSDEAITSTNGGQSWTTVNLPSPPQVDGVITPAGDVFYFDGNKNLYRSTDGGTSFMNVFTSENFPRRLGTDGTDLLFNDNRNAMHRSTDNGMTWTTLTTSLPIGGTIRKIWRGADDKLLIMNFLGARGFSTDDGTTWDVDAVAGFSLSAVVIHEGKVLAVGRRLGIWTSENDWRHYQYSLGEEQYYIAGISFGSRDVGYAIASDGYVLKTSDAGETWNLVNKAGRNTAKFVHAYDHEKALVQTSAGGIQYTNDGGTSFTDLGQELSLSITSTTALAILPNDDIAIMTGSRFYVVSPAWELKSTTDLAVTIGMPSSSKLTMVSAEVGILTGGGGSLWRTADSGATWTKILDGSITNQTYREAYFINSQLGYCGDQNISIRTTDGGLTWQVYGELPGGNNFVRTPSGAHLKMASNNRIFESSNNGISWREAAELPCGSTSFIALRPGTEETFISLGSTIARIDVDFTDAVRSPVVNDPGFQVYPNPTDGLLSLDIPALAGQKATVKVFDIAGKMVLRRDMYQQAQLDLGQLKAGVYVLSVYAKDGVRTQRVVVQ